MKLILEIITPTKVILKEEIDELTIQTIDGEISILPNHVNLFTKVIPGEMIIKNNNKTDLFAITGGFLEITNNQINILADYAIRAEDIEVAKSQEAEERAKQAMKNKEDRNTFLIAEGELRKAILELKVARKHKSARINN